MVAAVIAFPRGPLGPRPHRLPTAAPTVHPNNSPHGDGDGTSSVPGTVTVTAHPSSSVPRAPGGDLGLSRTDYRPACDGMGIVVLGSVTTPGQYASAVQRYLTAYPGAHYARTDMACPSLRQRSDDGNPIYAVFYPAGYTQSEPCAAVRRLEVRHTAGGSTPRHRRTIRSPADIRINSSTAVEGAGHDAQGRRHVRWLYGCASHRRWRDMGRLSG